MLMRVAVIPARGGSKRVPRKNIREFCGVPIIAYSIGRARESGLFDRIVVSTDDDEIATVAEKYGAEVPFLRPPELSGDYVGTAEVILDAVQRMGERERIAQVCCIYATAPFIRLPDLIAALELVERGEAHAAFPVTHFPAPIFRALKLTEDGFLRMFWPEHYNTRSNDLPLAVHDAGVFYWLDRSNFEVEKIIYAARSRPIIIPRYLVNDIDTEEDWQRAELMYEVLVKSGKISRVEF